ncbi:MAG TPA: RNA-binding protein [Firmicutes bacterium]|jgi:ribosome-associated protein|nr:RNA-binding protein [Bacillota bacterium]
MIETIEIHSNFIKLDQLLKMAGVTGSGSEAKFIITEGKILVNEEIEMRRGRKIIPGDRVAIDDRQFIVKAEGSDI